MEPLVKTQLYERGSYHCFDPNTFEMIRKVGLLNTSFKLFSLLYDLHLSLFTWATSKAQDVDSFAG